MKQEYNLALLIDAIQTFGVEAQIDMMVEEASELLNALMKFRRGRATEKEVITEIADVQIMCAQMEVVFERWRNTTPGATEAERQYKLDRLSHRLRAIRAEKNEMKL